MGSDHFKVGQYMRFWGQRLKDQITSIFHSEDSDSLAEKGYGNSKFVTNDINLLSVKPAFEVGDQVMEKSGPFPNIRKVEEIIQTENGHYKFKFFSSKYDKSEHWALADHFTKYTPEVTMQLGH